MAYELQVRRGTAAAATAANPTLAQGEMGFETDTGKLKIGDGVTAWTGLAYFGGGGSGAVASVFARTGAVVAASGDYSVGEVTGAAPLVSPTFTGTPAAPTAAAGTSTTQLATTAFVGGAVTKAWQFPVGAPSGGDDTAAINATIAAAVTYAQAHNNYAEVIFSANAPYLVQTAPTQTNSGNAQITIPLIADTAQKVILVLKGAVEQSALYHWLQTTSQLAGAVLESNYAGGTSPTTGNEPCVLGGPNDNHGYGYAGPLYSNMHLVIDGLGIVVPNDPQVAGFDFRGIAEVSVVSASVLAKQSTGSPPAGAPSVPDSGSGLWAFGLAMPEVNNNAVCDIGNFAVEGMVSGLQAYEHLSANTIRAVNCFNGIAFLSNSGAPHACVIRYAMIENCVRIIAFGGTANNIFIDNLDLEVGVGITTSIINDPSNLGYGLVNVSTNGTGAQLNANILNSGSYAPNGAANLKILNSLLPKGPQTAPSIPATTVALPNPFWRDAMVPITAGSSTCVVKIGAATIGTLAAGQFANVLVPSGQSITLTYTGTAPTWGSWILS
jgi:hypothetical protein